MNEHVALAAEAVLIAALEQLGDAVVGFNTARHVTLFNAAAERLWGCDRLEVIGQPIGQLLPDLAKVRRSASGVRNWRHGMPEEMAIQRNEGSAAVVSVGLSEISLATGALHLAIARDVTAEVATRDELRLLALTADKTDRVVIITDAQHRIAYVNHAFTEIFGYERSEVTGHNAYQVFTGTTASAETMGSIRRKVETGQGFHLEFPARDKHDRKIWLHAAVNPVIGPTGQIRNVVGVFADITEAKYLQMLQRDVLEAVANDLSLKAVMTLICERVEAAAPGVVCSVLSVEDGRRLRSLAAPSMPQHISDAIDGLVIGPATGSCGTAAYRGEPVIVTDVETDPLWADFRDLIRPVGLTACWSSPIKLSDGKVAGTFAFYFREKTGPSRWHERIVETCLHLCVLAFERHAANEHIARLAYSDTLTGLPNRTRLRDTVHQLVSAPGTARELAVLFLDIDRFKDVNDTLGHPVGDRLLVEIARRLQAELRPGDVVSRYGGDEFVIVLADAGAARARQVAERFIETLVAPVVIENMLLPVSASIGICLAPDDGLDEDTLLKHADTAMYEVKATGRAGYRFFSPEMNSLAQERLVLGGALRDALPRRQLSLSYQPQMDCRTGALRGVEALARWTHPIFGTVSPTRFIALAEECGLIEQIGQWALDEAAGQMARWLAEGIDVGSISVNLSAVHFRNRDLSRLVEEALAKHRLKPEMLTIEITEGVIMDDNPATIETAKAIHALGVNLSLDDFGTGYSSLSYLARLPIDELKIDRGFMEDLENDKNAQAVVTAVVKIGQSLGLTVVAEGVETRAQHRFLQALNCDVLQGFLVSRAMTAPEFSDWYADYAGGKGVVRLPGAA